MEQWVGLVQSGGHRNKAGSREHGNRTGEAEGSRTKTPALVFTCSYSAEVAERAVAGPEPPSVGGSGGAERETEAVAWAP